LSGNPFFALEKALAKKDWERKAEIAAIKILNDYSTQSNNSLKIIEN